MQAIFTRIQNISGSILALSLFGGAFLLGLAIFALSQSLIIAAATMGLVSLSGALATREWLSKRDTAQTQDTLQSEIRQQSRRVNAVSDRMIEIESELRSLRRPQPHADQARLDRLSKDVETIITIVSQVIKVVEAQESRLAKALSIDATRQAIPVSSQPVSMRPAIPSARHNSSRPAPSSEDEDQRTISPIQKPHNPLAALQTEGILREDIMGGKLKVRLYDIVQMLSGRVAMREMHCALEGRLPDLQSDTDLVANKISAGVIQLFDRVRFGYAFEMAGQIAPQPGAIPILCPIMNATFRNATSADEIVNLIEGRADIAEHLILSFDQSLILTLQDDERIRIQRLSAAGTRLAMRIADDFNFDPAEITALGFGYLIARATQLIDGQAEMIESAIHAADLASYFERYGLMLIANNVEDPAQLIKLKALGIPCAGGPGTMRPARARPSLNPPVTDRPEKSRAATATVTAPIPSPPPAPLRERLRRVQA